MSKRKNLAKRSKRKLQQAALNLVRKLTPEQKEQLAEILAKKVTTDVADNDSLRGETTGQ
jgi:Spy/CpxP family protein refolding chaperone